MLEPPIRSRFFFILPFSASPSRIPAPSLNPPAHNVSNKATYTTSALTDTHGLFLSGTQGESRQRAAARVESARGEVRAII